MTEEILIKDSEECHEIMNDVIFSRYTMAQLPIPACRPFREYIIELFEEGYITTFSELIKAADDVIISREWGTTVFLREQYPEVYKHYPTPE